MYENVTMKLVKMYRKKISISKAKPEQNKTTLAPRPAPPHQETQNRKATRQV
jgi:hypothetical protein